MDFENFVDKTRQALRANDSIAFFCNCEVTYSGRAEAHLPSGDRIIIIKSDNSLLVHQPEGSTPVNYMKDGSKIEIVKSQGRVKIKSRNLKYKDYLEIDVFIIHNFMSHRLEDGKKLILEGNEKDMSDMIFKKPELISKDFKPLSREEHTKYGFIDVFGHNKKGELMIIECKRYTAGPQCVTQLRRYVEKMKDLKGVKKVYGILAAPNISANANKMLKDWKFEFVIVNPPKRLEKYGGGQKGLLDF